MISNLRRLAKLLTQPGIFVGLMLLFPVTTITGQTIDGRIVGTTIDTTGAAVPSASITIINIDTSTTRTVRAD